MDREAYLREVKKRLSNIFSASSCGYKPSDVERHRLEGFMQAGVITGLSSQNELKTLMDEVHQSFFGKSIQERKAEKLSIWSGESIDYSQFEQPACKRKEC